MVFFFFKQKTAYEIKECDWSSDVCSSDLGLAIPTRSPKRIALIMPDSFLERYLEKVLLRFCRNFNEYNLRLFP